VKQIIVTISPGGQTTVTAQGFEGQECQRATASIRAALGVTTTERLTAEYYQPAEVASQSQKARH
jgi:Protein of unknown function (DUF2997)